MFSVEKTVEKGIFLRTASKKGKKCTTFTNKIIIWHQVEERNVFGSDGRERKTESDINSEFVTFSVFGV